MVDRPECSIVGYVGYCMNISLYFLLPLSLDEENGEKNVKFFIKFPDFIVILY